MLDAITRRYQFNIIHPLSGLKIDVMVPRNDDFDCDRFRRVQKLYPIKDIHVNFSSPEDVIIKKMEYYREGGSEKHLRDILSMMKISGETIQTDYIDAWAEKKGLSNIWSAIIQKLQRGSFPG